MKTLREISEVARIIDRISGCRELEGGFAYEFSGFSRDFKEILSDISAYEGAEIERLGLTFDAVVPGTPSTLIHPKQNVENLREYLDSRAKFLESREVDIDVPMFKIDQLKPAKLSSDDMIALMDFGMLETPAPKKKPKETENKE